MFVLDPLGDKILKMFRGLNFKLHDLAHKMNISAIAKILQITVYGKWVYFQRKQVYYFLPQFSVKVHS